MPASGRLCLKQAFVVVISAALVVTTMEALTVSPANAAPTPAPSFATVPAPAPAALAAPAERVVSRPDRVSAAATARAQGSPVKVDGEGSPRSETFVNPDGSFTTEAYQQPAFRRAGARRDGGSWVPLTAGLTGAGTASDPLVADGLARRVSIGASASELLSLDVPGGPVTVSAPGLRLGVPVRVGSKVTYADAATATALQLEVTPAGVKTNLVLSSLLAPKSFRFHLSDPDGRVGTPTEQPDRTWVFDRNLGDGWRLGLAAPSAWASAALDDLGVGVFPGTATQQVVRAGDGWDITLAVDADWLTRQVFPVVLDPSPVFVATGPGTQGMDCHIVSGSSATTNYCSAATRDVGFNTSRIRRTMASFDLTSIPTTGQVTAADLDLYLATTEAATGPIQVKAYRLTESWTAGATWNTRNGGLYTWMTAGGTHDTATTLATTTVATTAGHFHWVVSPAAVQNWVTSPGGNLGLILRSSAEATTGVLRFASGYATDPTQRPRLTVTYNNPPVRPAGRTVKPCSAQCVSPVATPTTTPTLSALAADTDATPLRYDFEVWAGSSASPTTVVTSGQVPNVAVGATAFWKVPAGTLASGSTYEYRVRAWDGQTYSDWSSGWAVFAPDTTIPSTPAVQSSAFPENQWGAPAGGTFTYSATDPGAGGSGLSGYFTKLDDEDWIPVPYTTTGRTLSNLDGGRHTFSVRAQDKAGNLSAARVWSFFVGDGGIVTPQPEDRTAARVTLAAEARTGRDWLTWQYHLGTDPAAGFTDIPLADVTTPGTTNHPAAWPVQRAAGQLPPLVWDVDGTLGGVDGPLQIRACFLPSATFDALYCGGARALQLAKAGIGGSYATTAAGPGTISLLTGDLSLSESDVEVPSYTGSLAVGRTLTTLAPSTTTTGATGVFGPAWTASLPGPEAGAAEQRVEDHSSAGYMALVSEDGTQDVYDQTATAGTTTTYEAIGDAGADGATLVKDTGPNPDTLTLTDLDGTVTVWSASGTTWGITRVTEPGAATTSYTRDANGRVTQILAPVPAGVTCTTPLTTAGCRTLTLTYSAGTTATGTGSTQWGTYLGRLERVDFTAYNPATTAMATTAVAAYSYDSTGLLRAAWDPRITPALKTSYSYGAGNRLTSVTPPGLSGWSIGYDGANRVTTVTRPNPGGGTRTTTVRYAVPFTGASAPLELGKATTDAWGQTDLPATAAAVWGPDRVPAATPSTADWQYADLTYLDANGRAVNTASYGAGAWQVTTTEYDRRGNTVRTLSAGNRNDAINPAGNLDLDSYVATVTDSATRAGLLSETTVYSWDGVDELASFGPMHPVILDDGTTVSAREHTTTTYDQGAPGGEYRLPTTSVTAAQTPDGVDHDPRTTLTGYDPVVAGDASGWDLRQATTTATDMPGATPDIVKRTRYNAVGQEIETRMPSEAAAGGGPGTSRTTYYTGTGSGTCGGKPYWAGLTCQIAPAAQPATGPNLPTVTTTYTLWDAPDTITEVAGTTTRTTTRAYDAAERPTDQSVVVTPAGSGGSPVPPVSATYNSLTGMVAATSTSNGGVDIGRDSVGQVTSYTQTNAGTVVSTATRTFDSSGRTATFSDGKGTTTYGYDNSSDHRGVVVSISDTLAGSFAANYNANGQLDTLNYPGGMVASTRYNNASTPTRLTYTKSGATWLDFSRDTSIFGQIRHTTTPTSEQSYSYDAAARLVRADDAAAGNCTRRDYTFDANTNRTSLTSTVGSPSSSTSNDLCDLTGSGSAVTGYTYDDADRAAGTGYSYDALGRTTTLPAVAVASGTTLSIGYSANDRVSSLSVPGRTKTYGLDPLNRVLTVADTAGPTLTNHYTDPEDSPSWIGFSDGTWTRMLHSSINGADATTTSAGVTNFQLPNLHGDVVATATASSAAPDAYYENTEYGETQPFAPSDLRYGWLGAYHRNTGDGLASVTLMGARLYNPRTGRFTSPDPVSQGSCNKYEYACGDPLNNLDLDGCAVCTATNAYVYIGMYVINNTTTGWRKDWVLSAILFTASGGKIQKVEFRYRSVIRRFLVCAYGRFYDQLERWRQSQAQITWGYWIFEYHQVQRWAYWYVEWRIRIRR